MTFLKVVSDFFPFLFFFFFQKMDKGEVNLYRTLPPLGSHPSTVCVETSITPVLLNSGGRHWLQDRGNKDHWVVELHNLCAWGETQWEDKVGGRSLSRPTFLLNVNVGRPGKKKTKGTRSSLFLTCFLTNSYWTPLKGYLVILIGNQESLELFCLNMRAM